MGVFWGDQQISLFGGGIIGGSSGLPLINKIEIGNVSNISKATIDADSAGNAFNLDEFDFELIVKKPAGAYLSSYSSLLCMDRLIVAPDRKIVNYFVFKYIYETS